MEKIKKICTAFAACLKQAQHQDRDNVDQKRPCVMFCKNWGVIAYLYLKLTNEDMHFY